MERKEALDLLVSRIFGTGPRRSGSGIAPDGTIRNGIIGVRSGVGTIGKGGPVRFGGALGTTSRLVPLGGAFGHRPLGADGVIHFVIVLESREYIVILVFF